MWMDIKEHLQTNQFEQHKEQKNLTECTGINKKPHANSGLHMLITSTYKYETAASSQWHYTIEIS